MAQPGPAPRVTGLNGCRMIMSASMTKMKSSVGCTSYMQQGPFGRSKTITKVQQLVCSVQVSLLLALLSAIPRLTKLQSNHVSSFDIAASPVKANWAESMSQSMTNCLLTEVNQNQQQHPIWLTLSQYITAPGLLYAEYTSLCSLSCVSEGTI